MQTAQRYIGLYPNSADTPYVYYLAGMSFYNQVPDVMRDQSVGGEGAGDFQRSSSQKFPKSEYVNDAQIQDARRRETSSPPRR